MKLGCQLLESRHFLDITHGFCSEIGGGSDEDQIRNGTNLRRRRDDSSSCSANATGVAPGEVTAGVYSVDDGFHHRFDHAALVGIAGHHQAADARIEDTRPQGMLFHAHDCADVRWGKTAPSLNNSSCNFLTREQADKLYTDIATRLLRRLFRSVPTAQSSCAPDRRCAPARPCPERRRPRLSPWRPPE